MPSLDKRIARRHRGDGLVCAPPARARDGRQLDAAQRAAARAARRPLEHPAAAALGPFTDHPIGRFPAPAVRRRNHGRVACDPARAPVLFVSPRLRSVSRRLGIQVVGGADAHRAEPPGRPASGDRAAQRVCRDGRGTARNRHGAPVGRPARPDLARASRARRARSSASGVRRGSAPSPIANACG